MGYRLYEKKIKYHSCLDQNEAKDLMGNMKE